MDEPYRVPRIGACLALQYGDSLNGVHTTCLQCAETDVTVPALLVLQHTLRIPDYSERVPKEFDLRLFSASFEGPSIDDELMCDGYLARVPANLFENLAPDTPHYSDDIEILWFVSDAAPAPDDEWLANHFPSPNEVISAVRDCFEQYAQHCEANWRSAVMADLEEEQRAKFEEYGWLPFVYIERILINAALDAVCVECLCEIDPHLIEHEVAIIRKAGNWRFGSGDDRYELFAGWDGTPI